MQIGKRETSTLLDASHLCKQEKEEGQEQIPVGHLKKHLTNPLYNF